MLAKHGLIDGDLAGRLRRVVGFRNIAVHQYQTLDLAIILAIADKHPGDLHVFAARIPDHPGLEQQTVSWRASLEARTPRGGRPGRWLGASPQPAR